jgi:LysM repeat protein
MQRSSLSFVLLLCASALIAACGPTAPTPLLVESPRPPERAPTQARAMIQSTPTSAPTAYPTLAGGCIPPVGWKPYSIQSGDTLYALAQQSKTTTEEILSANCLASTPIQPGQIIYLPLTQCTPTSPEGWGAYVVRGGDTLYSLATTRGTTVDEVKRVNCLISDSLRVGQNLYLPPLQQLPGGSIGCTTSDCSGGGVGEVVIAPAPVATPPLCSPFVCKPQSGVGAMVVLPGAPNDPVNRKPCTPQQGGPWIDAVGHKSEIDPARPRVLELGERSYFFACEFPARVTTAVITMSNGTSQLLTLADSVLHPALDSGGNPFVAWAAKPTQPLGTYELSFVGGPDVEPFTFEVRAPTREHILAVPVADSPGRGFEMYYVNFKLNDIAQIDFYEEDQPSAEITHTLSFRRSALVQIDQTFPQPELSNSPGKGWKMETFQTEANYPHAIYGAAFDNRRVSTLFWLR